MSDPLERFELLAERVREGCEVPADGGLAPGVMARIAEAGAPPRLTAPVLVMVLAHSGLAVAALFWAYQEYAVLTNPLVCFFQDAVLPMIT